MMDIVTWSAPSMGGTLEISLLTADADDVAAAGVAARRAAQRVEAWAARLTRFNDSSDLSLLNATEGTRFAVRPTLGAALAWAEVAERRSEGIVSPTLLDERLAAEFGATPDSAASSRPWRLDVEDGRAIVERSAAFRFDLDGLAKGWIADRAADLLRDWPSVAVDADGDISFHLDPGVEWRVAVADPRPDADPDEPLLTLRLHNGESCGRSFGVATSGTSVHRWRRQDGSFGHHLIDRRTGLPADTDVVQATVIGPTAREAEVIAKSAVILGSQAAYAFLERSAAQAAILLLESDELVAMPGVERWLA